MKFILLVCFAFLGSGVGRAAESSKIRGWQQLAGIFESTFIFGAVQGGMFTMGSPANDPEILFNEPL